MNLPKKIQNLYIRNFIFGIEDGLVSTVGLLSGVVVAGAPKYFILTTGLILIFVEAFSMGAGSFLSEHSAEEYTERKHKIPKQHLLASLIMFLSYFIAGFIALLPYIIVGLPLAFWLSIVFALLALATLGAINAKLYKVKIWHHSFEVFAIGGTAVLVGVGIGKLAKILI